MSVACRLIDAREALDIEFRVELAEPVKDSIRAQVSRQKTLEDVVRWGLTQKPPRLIADVVIMDEFNHDVVIEFLPSIWLVYDTT